MFYGCTSLTQAPVLPATTLAQYCYNRMFSGCNRLNEVRCQMPSSYSSSDIPTYTSNWLSNVSSTGTFYTNADANWSSGASGIPEGWTRVPAVAPTADDPNKPLMLRAIADNSSVTLTKTGTVSEVYQTSTNGTDWTNYTLGTKISLNGGESVYFRRRTSKVSQSSSSYVQFVMEGEIEAWHNAYSMISPSFTKTEVGVGMYGMYALFKGCSPLTKAPLLVNPVGDSCYGHMFEGCTSLTKAPELPYTTLRDYCYTSMFEGCTSLTKAPELPATTLASYCYFRMFYGCTSLTQAPSIPVTNLASYCYCYMFSGCTSLTQAPELPATNLASYCYDGMFEGCASLKEVRISATKSDVSDPLKEWLSGVSATGDFYCDPNATIFPIDSPSGIPKGWTRHNINALKALTLTATADNSSVKLTKKGTLDNTFEVDKGNGWEGYAFGTVIPLNAGESCKWRCSAHPTTQSDQNYVQFVMTGKIEASGNVNSMLSSGFENLTSLSGYNYAFRGLFKGCTSLTQAPQLSATALVLSCYASMFEGCTSLTQAPQLPATTLETNCYASMFEGCTSLTQAPALPAKALAASCYGAMFWGCSKLNEVRIAATTTETYALNNWLRGVSATGDFYCDPNATIFPTDSVVGIPKGWVRHALADYPVTP